ncbi:putative carboxypeptidase S-like 2 [Nymphon striatum]|nr:putative carboxypeptidase S-like 2 [Nymphon striatum]
MQSLPQELQTEAILSPSKHDNDIKAEASKDNVTLNYEVAHIWIFDSGAILAKEFAASKSLKASVALNEKQEEIIMSQNTSISFILLTMIILVLAGLTPKVIASTMEPVIMQLEQRHKKLYYSANYNADEAFEPNDSEIYELNLSDKKVTALTDRYGPDDSPKISPDGTKMAYTGLDDKLLGYQQNQFGVDAVIEKGYVDTENLFVTGGSGGGEKKITEQPIAESEQFYTALKLEGAVPDSAAFLGFHRFLKATFPLTHEKLSLEKINDYSLLYKWEDVVPVDQPTLGDWEAGPFDGKITATDIVGFASFKLIVETNGGHSSAPPRENTIGMLAQAIVDLENNQLPYKLVKPIDYQFEYIGAELPFFKRIAFANPWLLKKPVLEALNAHTTTAPTIINGGVKNNVIPTVAEATINFRILPGETIDLVEEHIKSTISDKIKVERSGFLTNPSPVSSIDSEAYKTLEQTIRNVFPSSIVVPGLVGGGTDARYFYAVSDDVYRFYPIRIGPDSMTRFHGIDEKISKENYKEIIAFTYHLIKNYK